MSGSANQREQRLVHALKTHESALLSDVPLFFHQDRINAFESIIESSKKGRGAVAQTMLACARAQGYAHSFAAAEPCPPGPGLSSRCRARLFPPPPPALLLLLFKPAICDTRIETQYLERARDGREWEG